MNQDVLVEPAVRFSMTWEHGRLVTLATSSPPLNHFFELLNLTRAYHTWVNYAHDLKVFFSVIAKPPEEVTRADCLSFLRKQAQMGHADATINRRIAAASSLFHELSLLDPVRFPHNPVQPSSHHTRQARRGLYRRQAQRIPDIIDKETLQRFFGLLPTWRDRTIILLMWISCLRISEVLAIRFQEIECSRRSIVIPAAKWGNARTAFMDTLTFTVLNRYLDEERKQLFPEEDHLFVAFKGRARGLPLSVSAVQKMVKYHAARCGSPHLHPHLFRHTGITQLVQQGMAEPTVRQLVGHRHPGSLLPYLHLSDEFVAQEFAKAQVALAVWTGLSIGLPGGDA
jgi:integrase/recombinase XerD